MMRFKRTVSRRALSAKIAGAFWAVLFAGMTSYGTGLFDVAAKDNDVVTLRVCNWEEYIDLGDWDEEETIDL